jgi:hypothetical protein
VTSTTSDHCSAFFQLNAVTVAIYCVFASFLFFGATPVSAQSNNGASGTLGGLGGAGVNGAGSGGNGAIGPRGGKGGGGGSGGSTGSGGSGGFAGTNNGGNGNAGAAAGGSGSSINNDISGGNSSVNIGFSNYAGGGGGGGGLGFLITNASILSNAFNVRGGNGGAGGRAFLSTGVGGNGGSGGAGIGGSYFTLTNSGNVTGGYGGNGGALSGTTSGSAGNGGSGIFIYSGSGSGVNITNLAFGVIAGGTAPSSGSNGAGIQVDAGGIMNTLTNIGSISPGRGFGIAASGISNIGTITTLNNQQNTLTYRGYLPVNYNVIISGAPNAATYGKLSVTSGNNSPGTSGISFNIYGNTATTLITGVPASTIVTGTYSSVVAGLNSGNIMSSSLSGTYPGGYSWQLLNSSGVLWDLVVTLSPSSGGSASSSSSVDTSSSSSVGTSSPATPTNVSTGTSVSLSSIGVTFNPVLSGGTLVLTKGERSNQPLVIQGTGSSIAAPITGAAQMYGVLSGPGRLTFNGTGMTVLSAVNTYSGGTVVESGTLSLLGGTLGTGDVYVAPGAQLVGTGSISGPVTVAGLFKPGNSPGYIGANASVTMSSGSVYQQDIAGTTQSSASSPVGASGYYSYLNITGGQFIISSGVTLIPALSNLFNTLESGYGSAPYTPLLGDRFRIVTADGGISGKFTTVTQPVELSADTQFLPFYNMDGTNSLDLAVIPKSYAATLAVNSGNKNAQSVGAALDKMVVATQTGVSTSTQDQLLYASSTQNAAGLSDYAQSLAGEIYAAAVAVIAQTTQRVQQAVLTRLGDTMGIGLPNSMTNPAGNTALMAASNTALSGGVASSAVSTNPAVNPNTETRAFSNGNVWGDLAYQKGNRSSDSNSGGWNTNLYQLVFGSDFYVSNGMRLGGGIALSNTTLNPTYGSGTIQQGSVFAYGKMPIEVYVVDAMASFGVNSSDLSRSDITSLSNGFRNKSISGNDAMVSLGLSRPIDLDNFRITPYARVTWQMVTQSSVNEGDTASALSVNGFTGNGVRGVLGIAAGSKVNDPMSEKLTYRAYVGLGVDSSGLLNPTLNASLAGMGTNITTPNAGTTFVQAGLYGTAKLSDNAYAFAGLSGEARSGQTLGAVNVGLRVQF